MDFKKDILLIDTEFSGFDDKKHELLQLAGILLDKKTLKEKKVFSSFVRSTKWKHRDLESMAVNKITLDMVKDAPSLKEVVKEFDRVFGHDVILASYVSYNDKKFLTNAYKKTGVKFNFDYHFFDLWGLFYGYLASKNKLTSVKNFAGFGLEHMVKMFKIKADEALMHDALVDCRVEAEVLRKVMKSI